MTLHGMTISQEALTRFCLQHKVRRLSLFGSILRDDFSPQSDVDVLVEFSGPSPSLFTLGGMLMELRDMFGREVDLKTPSLLSDYFRDQVMCEARVLYAA